MSDEILAPISYGAIGLVGLWLVWRGVRRASKPRHTNHHNHDSSVCSACGHRHGPSVEEVSELSNWRETLGLIGSIAMRPCTGALFLLIITWQMQIPLVGILGAFAMALGTASVTIGVGLTALGFRGGLVRAFAESTWTARLIPMVEITAGLLVVLVAGGLLTQGA
jgi:ABC-type nickel/cobalt efflux system permease component RcnA